MLRRASIQLMPHEEGSKKKKPDQWLKPYNFPGIGKPIDL